MTILPDWPPNSPNLDPIENVSALMKQRVHALEEQPHGREATMAAIRQEWANLTRLQTRNPRRSDVPIASRRVSKHKVAMRSRVVKERPWRGRRLALDVSLCSSSWFHLLFQPSYPYVPLLELVLFRT